MVPRASAIKEQGFSEAVAAQIEAPQKGSTRSVYEAKWTIFPKWCLSNQVDFRTPPVKSIADFLLYQFQDRKLEPIDGYRSAIASRLFSSWPWGQANTGVRSMIGKRSLPVRLFKGVFVPSTQLSKNQLAKEGPDSVAPVVITALAPTLDKSLRSDRSLCPVRALHYYLDRTSDIRQNKELVFVSFKKGFDKDISHATISSWIKQTVILCYELSDREALTLHQVKAHDVRTFAASKAFQSGVSLEQILSACQWKSHNTFTQFDLKDVACADSELFTWA